ncbi:hypothetical protein GT022_13105 [Agaribacter marinus]|uniref:Uncharacterized protein n=1 Tax=Virgibacillus salarius TaxID=447199 RepID=A0A941I9P7_9BACI|nr:hypothetical protein [Virgibacillus salarius]MBR7796984.1 hypothetical protein [Virgibacillus salarius]NAZ09694.1 hypothetical protein [Agaribacter marinus]
MIDREKEFRNAFYFSKRCAKSPLTPSYTIGYSRGNADKEPAKKVYDYILSLGEKSISFEEKLNLLYKFLEQAEQEERNKRMMGTDFYSNIMTYIRISKRQIDNGEPVQTRRR